MKSNENIPYLMLSTFIGGLIGGFLSDIIFGEFNSFIVELCIKAAMIAVCQLILYFLIMVIAKRRNK